MFVCQFAARRCTHKDDRKLCCPNGSVRPPARRQGYRLERPGEDHGKEEGVVRQLHLHWELGLPHPELRPGLCWQDRNQGRHKSYLYKCNPSTYRPCPGRWSGSTSTESPSTASPSTVRPLTGWSLEAYASCYISASCYVSTFKWSNIVAPYTVGVSEQLHFLPNLRSGQYKVVPQVCLLL